MKNINSQVLRKTFAFSLVRFTLARFTLVRFTLARFVLAAILIPALLIGSAFTFGGSNLQAQAVQNNTKSGFFAGFVYLNGFKVDTTTLVTTNITTITDATTTSYRIDLDRGNGGYGETTSSIDAIGGNPGWSNNNTTGLRTLIEANCETGATRDTVTHLDGSTGDYYFLFPRFSSFDPGKKPSLNKIEPSGDATVTLATNANPFHTGEDGSRSHCHRYFSEKTLLNYQIATADYSVSTPNSVHAAPRTTTSKSDKISGIGLQFGFRWEKWRASLTHFTGSGGANELANTLVMADYFVNEDFFVGGGLASMKLTNSLTSASATSPAIQIGYKRNLTPNLSLNFGLTKYISGVSLKNSVTNTTTTTTTTTTTNSNNTPIVSRFEETQTKSDSATIGAESVRIPGPPLLGGITPTTTFLYLDQRPNGIRYDQRMVVTQVRSRTVYINKIQIPAGASETQTTTTTETDAELKAPLVISISFHLSF